MPGFGYGYGASRETSDSETSSRDSESSESLASEAGLVLTEASGFRSNIAACGIQSLLSIPMFVLIAVSAGTLPFNLTQLQFVLFQKSPLPSCTLLLPKTSTRKRVALEIWGRVALGLAHKANSV